MPPPSRAARPDLARRLAWLILCVAIGAAAAGTGQTLTGNDAWLLAVPAAIAAGWLFFARPTECDPRQRDGQDNGHRRADDDTRCDADDPRRDADDPRLGGQRRAPARTARR